MSNPFWIRPSGAGGFYAKSQADLDAVMRDDPFYNPDVPLAGVIFAEEAAKPDPFEQAEEANPAAQFRKFLQGEEDKKLEQPSTFYADHWRVAMAYKAGKWVCNAQKDGETKRFALSNLGSDRDSAMAAAGKYLQQFNTPWRSLTAIELDTISRIASAGTSDAIQFAAVQYVCYALNKHEAGELDDNGEHLLSDPRYMPLLGEAVWFAFRHGKPDVDDEAERWMLERLAGRAVTVNSLFAVYELLTEERKKQSRSLLFNPRQATETELSLEDLTDEAIAETYHQTVRHIAKGSN